MLWHNDEKLTRRVPDIDIVLGGHNHDYGVKKVTKRSLLNILFQSSLKLSIYDQTVNNFLNILDR